jgi:hypothetical protein
VRELVPDIEAHWIETYGRVAATGESTRFQMASEAMGRWFDVFAFRIGDPAARQVAVLFSDVTAARAARPSARASPPPSRSSARASRPSSSRRRRSWPWCAAPTTCSRS